ncbi:MerR family transcriptional regulator [Streptomyces sp. NPDC093252]|uniref:MerR family transcriptional regulator n=1 Tax=Streptomyces sp. NPDC093252 TaxID=3154980 RepID=UPI00343C23DA
MHDDPDPAAGAGDGTRLLTIGAFAARARLSPKALRLYDQLGLLSPDRVDEATGYRYYRAEQVERARLVALLRRLDMPLARICAVVAADGPEAARLLDGYWAEVETRIAGQRTLAAYLRGRLSGRNSEMYGTFEIETADVAARVVITETRHTLADELPAWIGASLGRLTEAAVGDCGGIVAPPFVVYHAEVSTESDGPAESCVPVADEAAARAWAGRRGRAWETAVRVEPARRLAYTRITKAQVAYPQIIAAYEAVEQWIAGRGLRQAGPPREVYFADWDAAGPGDPVCDIAFPVE